MEDNALEVVLKPGSDTQTPSSSNTVSIIRLHRFVCTSTLQSKAAPADDNRLKAIDAWEHITSRRKHVKEQVS